MAKKRQTHSYVARQQSLWTTFTCDREAEVLILIGEEYAKFSIGEGCTGSVLHCKASKPVHFRFPQAGHWNLVFSFEDNNDDVLKVHFER